MKRLFVGAMFLMLLLSSCKKTTIYPLSQVQSAITTIDIVKIEDFRIVNTGNFDMIYVLKSFDSSEHSLFFSSFYEIPCYKSLGPSQECLDGIAIRFQYADGAFQLVGAATSFYCSAQNDRSFIAYYFDYDLFYQYLREQVAKGQGDGLREPY